MTDLSTSIAKKQVEQKTEPSMLDLIRAQQPAIEAQLSGTLSSSAFVRAAISEIKKSEKLQMASSSSVLGSIMLAAQLKLEIGSALGYFYLTPRKDHDKWVCVPIIGYKGLIELAYRSGRVGKIETLVVRKGDLFEYGANSERGRYFDWKPADRDLTREWTDIVVAAQIIGGGIVWETLPREKILSRRPTGWEKGPWKTNEEEMSRKSLVREVEPYLPKSTEFGLAVQVARQVEEEGKVVQSIAGVHELVVGNEPFTGDPSQLTPDEQADLDADHGGDA